MFEPVFPRVPLSDLTVAIKDGSHGTHKRVAGGVPLLSAKNVVNGDLVWSDADDQITEREYQALTRSFSPIEGDLLLTVVGTLGRCARYDGSKVAFQRSVAFLRPNEIVLERDFLLHAASHASFRRALEQRSNATAQAGVYLGELAKVCIDLPPLEEQRKIAEVLDTVDEAIRKTEQIIAKLKLVKQGLLHDLLTRGIDEHGELRDPERHPEQFKKSVLGRIPRAWEVVSFSRLVTDVYRYPTYHGIEYVADGVPEIRGAMLQSDGSIAGVFRCISEATAARFPRVRVTPDDFVLSVRGTLGKIGRVTTALEGSVITANLLKVRFGAQVDPLWMLRFLLSERFQTALDSVASATTIRTVQVPTLLSLQLALPSREEQAYLASMLSLFDNGYRLEHARVNKLRLLKQALMNDLLTGKVRVTNLLETSP